MNKNIVIMVAAAIATHSIIAPTWSMALSSSYEKNLGDGEKITIETVVVTNRSQIHEQLDNLKQDPSDLAKTNRLRTLCAEIDTNNKTSILATKKYDLNEKDPKTGLSPLQTALKMQKEKLILKNNPRNVYASAASKQYENDYLGATRIVKILHENGARRTVLEKFKDLPELHQQAIMLGLFGLFWTTASITNLEGFGLYSKVFLLIYIGACTYVIDYKYFLDQTP